MTQAEDIIVGSSPLMLVHALYRAQKGHRVCVVDRTDNWGGSWQLAHLDTGDSVEIACHVIEVFPGIYDLLEKAAGVPFLVLDAQPIRVHRSGFTIPYFNRLLMVASGLRLLVGYGKVRLDALIKGAGDRNQLINFQTKLRSYVRHQLGSFFASQKMRGPRDGYADFLEKLTEACRNAGVEFIVMDVISLTREAGQWTLIGADGVTRSAQNVFLTTATNLRPLSEVKYQASPPQFAQRYAAVVLVDKSDIVTSHTYVAFWRDPQVARISRVDMPDADPSSDRFLVEFHSAPAAGEDELLPLIENKLAKAGILKTGGAFSLVGAVSCEFTQYIDLLPSGSLAPGLWALHSSGNLAAGLAAWQSEKHDIDAKEA
jgi:hypothetical protein